MTSNNALVLAIALIALWVVATVTKIVVGAILNLLLVAGVLLLLFWGIRKLI